MHALGDSVYMCIWISFLFILIFEAENKNTFSALILCSSGRKCEYLMLKDSIDGPNMPLKRIIRNSSWGIAFKGKGNRDKTTGSKARVLKLYWCQLFCYLIGFNESGHRRHRKRNY